MTRNNRAALKSSLTCHSSEFDSKGSGWRHHYKIVQEKDKNLKKKPPEGIQLMMFNFLGMKDDQWENTKVLEGSEKYTGAYNIH